MAAKFQRVGSRMELEIYLKSQQDPILVEMVQNSDVNLDFGLKWWMVRRYLDSKNPDHWKICAICVEDIAMVTVMWRDILTNDRDNDENERERNV
jgi:hypothetical protein